MSRATDTSPSGAILPHTFLFLATVFAWATALAELSLQGARKFVLHRVIHQPPDILWMTPTAYFIVFAVPGLAMAALAWRRPSAITLRAATTVYAFLFFFSVLLLGPFHKLASAVLAAGLALQLGRLAGRQQPVIARTASRAWRPYGLPLALVTVIPIALTAFGMTAWRDAKEEDAHRASPAPAPGAANVLLIILDTVRAASLSVYGYDVATTPRLEEFARSSVLFDQAIATSPWTLPTHASIFTGRWAHELSANWRSPLDATYPTLAEIFGAQGYATAAFVANTFYGGYEHGLNRGFMRYEDYGRSPGDIVASSALGRAFGCWNREGPGCRLRSLVGYYDLLGRKQAPDVNRQVLRWLDRHSDRPFFAFVNYFDAHAPYLPPAPFDDTAGPAPARRNPMHLESADWTWTPDQVSAEQAAYDGALAYLDHHLGELFTSLRQQGLLDNTVVIVTSDHGEEFAEHRVMTHGNSLYIPSLHVPLLISAPGRIPSGSRVPNAVSLRDLGATILDVAGLGSAGLPGTSLAPLWETAETPTAPYGPALSEVTNAGWRPTWYPVSQGDMRSVVVGRYHWITNGDESQELYAIDEDPWETIDLVKSPAGSVILDSLRTITDFPELERGRD